MKYSVKILLSVILVLIILSIFIQPNADAENYKVVSAFDFSAVDEQGSNFSLNDYKGDVIIIHFTGLETPLCIECLEEMENQIKELERLYRSEINVTIITINFRKNPFSRLQNCL